MRKSLIIPFVLFLSLRCYSQNAYYWSSNTKNNLTTDSTTVIVKTAATVTKANAKSFFNTMTGMSSSSTYIDSTHLVLKYSHQILLNDVLTAFSGSNIKVNDLMYAYNFNQLPFVPTGDILCKLNQAASLNDILNLAGTDQVQSEYTDQYQVMHIIPVHLNMLLPLANKIYESGLVAFCHPNFIAKVTSASNVRGSDKQTSSFAKMLSGPNDTYYSDQYYLKNTGQTGGTYGVDINIEPAWTIPASNAVIRVAVIDNGVESHEDISGRVLSGYTPLDPNGHGAPRNSFIDGHGEACSGIIAATKNNALGIAGICPSAVIIPINVQYGGETVNDIANGINWAWTASQGNADVISSSVGFSIQADVISNAITNARTMGRGGKGTVVIFAAGNLVPNNVPVYYPAGVNGVISVGGIDKNGTRWYYSPNSPSLVAPTGDLSSAGDVYTTDRMGVDGFNSGNYMSNFGGTSAACPQAAGVAALMLTVNPTLTETQVRTAIINNAFSMGNTVSFGAGRLNAYAAIQATLPVISGIQAFCTSSVFTCSQVPTGASVTWSVLPTGVVTLTPSGTQVTATRVSKGSATLTATTSGGSAAPQTVNYSITTIPAVTAISSQMSGTCNGNYQTWYVSATPNMAGATNWQWTVQNPFNGTVNIFNPNAQSTYLSVTGGGQILVTYLDACGDTSAAEGVTIYSPCHMGDAIVAFPNPASNQLTIQNDTASPAGQSATANSNNVAAESFSVELFNAKGQVIKSGQTAEGSKSVVLNTADMVNGTYFLHVTQNGQTIEKQIIIKH